MHDNIICPHCKASIPISEAISAQLTKDLRREFEQQQARHEEALAKREATLRDQQAAVKSAEAKLDEQVEARLADQRDALVAKALKKAKGDVALELEDQAEQLAEARAKVNMAERAELELRKQKRELEEQQKAMELTLTRELDAERPKIREEAKKEAANERLLKEAEKEKLIDDLRRQIADLQRKSEQGSQQLQGEVMELSLEDQLTRAFAFDEIMPVPKGVHGGDVVQCVHDKALGHCGSMLWESKRTKSWSDAWLVKLRDNQRAAKAQLSILVTIELPPSIESFGQIEGVWVCGWNYAIPLAIALRSSVVQIAAVNRSLEGRQDKMDLLYQYLAGPEFKHRVEGIVESFSTLQSELEKERRSMERLWSAREKQLKRAVLNTAGLYGDLQGIVGATLPQIEKLQLPSSTDSNGQND